MIAKKILITGVSGLLGSNLAFAYRDKYDVAGIYNKHRVKMDGVRAVRLDLLDQAAFMNFIGEYKPDVIIHSAALSNVDKCEKDKALADRLNIKVTENVARSLAGKTPHLIYISTDAVYDGVEGKSNENELNPVNHYARTKLLGEKAALWYKNTMVARTNFFGWNIQDKLSLSEWVLDSLSNKKVIEGFGDVCFSGIYTLLLADILEKVFQKKISGIYNLGSSDSMSKYDFAVKIADTFKLNKSLIKNISIDRLGLPARRSKNMSMDVKKLEKAIDFNMPVMDISISAFYEDYKNGVRSKLKKGQDDV